jgi:hypothetical protein
MSGMAGRENKYVGEDPTAGPGAIEKQRKDNALHEELDETLKQETGNSEVYEALRNFLLVDPESQVEQLGKTDELLARAEDARNKNQAQLSRAMYETAAKVAIYKRRKDDATRCIALAKEVTSSEDEHSKMQETLISNMDEVMQISKEYYDEMTEKQGG